ncbi:MAG: hypothetical protein D6798_17100 [Deltaproteobacteria bacterium]|nr:MAG: hypothetical protein D6798_17100 [Deltaproteobacteria bacterium]
MAPSTPRLCRARVSGVLVTAGLAPLGCNRATDFDLTGIWRFEVQVTDQSEDACSSRILHNLVDAYEADESGDTGDTGSAGWIEDSSSAASPWTGLGRFASDGDRMLLQISGMLLVQEDASTTGDTAFSWERFESESDQTSHPSGYLYRSELEQTAGTRIRLTLPNETQQKDARRGGVPPSLTGAWEEASETTLSWEEADLWPEELGIGDVGSIPLGSYLSRLDSLGYVVPASNSRTESDCSDTTCVLSVDTACAWSWELTATLTDMQADDVGWDELQWPSGL